MAVDVGSAVGYLDLDISGFLSGLSSAQAEADKQTKNIATKIGGNLSSAGKSLTSAGSTLTKTVTVPVIGVGAAVVKMSSNFESAMSKVQAISGASGDDLEALNKKAQEMGAKTKFSATESAEAFTYMAMAGWKTQDMLDGIDGIMNLAAADGLDLATTSDIVTDALTAFGLSASDSGHFADVLAKASSNANTNVSMLGESFKYAAPVAGALGYSAEDTAIALGLMANAGIKGSQGGTALRGSLTRLIKPTDNAAALMEQYGLSMTNADGSMKSLGEVMNMLRDRLGGLTEAEQAQAAAQIFGQEAMSGMLAIINASDSDYAKLTDAIYDADGAAQQMADTMLDNLSGQLTLLKSALEGLAIQFGEILMPYIKQFVVWLQNLTQKLQELTPEQKEQIVKWVGIAAAIGPAIFAIGKITAGVGNVVTAFGKLSGGFSAVAAGGHAGAGALAKLGGAFASITAPIAAIIAIVAVLIAAFTSLWKNNEGFRESIIAIWDEIKNTFTTFVSGIVEGINSLGFNFESITEVLKTIWEEFCNFLAPIFTGAFQLISEGFQAATGIILGIFNFFVSLFKGDWQGCWDSVKGIFESVWGGITGVFQSIVDTIIGIGQTILGWFGVEWNTGIDDAGSSFNNVWQSVSDFFSSIWNGIYEFFSGIIQSIKDSVSPLFTEISGAFQMAWDVIQLVWSYAEPFFAAIWEGIKAAFSVVASVLTGFFSAAWEGIKGAWSVVVAFFKLIWNNIKAVFSVVGTVLSGFFKVAWEGIKAVWNTVVSFFTLVWAGIKAVFAVVKGVLSGNFEDAWNAIKNVWDKAKSFFNTVWNGVKSVFSSVVLFFKNTFNSAWTAIKNVFSNFGSFFSNLWDTIKNTFVNLGTRIGDAIGDSVKAGINGVIGMIENTINGFIGLINGAIDVINAIPGVSISKISKLSFNRLAKGGVVTSPTFAQIGEDGAEAVVPLEKNLGWIKNLAKEFMNRLGEFFNKRLGFNEKLDSIRNVLKDTLYEILDISEKFKAGDLGYTSYNGFNKPSNVNKWDNGSSPDNNSGSGGDTFNFYSPKPIDEIEAAKQMKKVKRELAEGF